AGRGTQLRFGHVRARQWSLRSRSGKIQLMRQGWLWAVSIAAVVSVSACGGEPAAVAPPTDVLVLEVGGAKPSLRASLVALGRSVAPGYELRPRSLPVGPAVDRNIPGTRDPGFTPVPTPKPSGPVDGPVEPVEPDPV